MHNFKAFSVSYIWLDSLENWQIHQSYLTLQTIEQIWLMNTPSYCSEIDLPLQPETWYISHIIFVMHVGMWVPGYNHRHNDWPHSRDTWYPTNDDPHSSPPLRVLHPSGRSESTTKTSEQVIGHVKQIDECIKIWST